MKLSNQGWSNISSYTYPSGNFQTLESNWRWLWPLKSILLETNLHLLEHQKVLRGVSKKLVKSDHPSRYVFVNWNPPPLPILPGLRLCTKVLSPHYAMTKRQAVDYSSIHTALASCVVPGGKTRIHNTNQPELLRILTFK